jgi:cobalt-zinc-cadmium efflux system outer membrane protein
MKHIGRFFLAIIISGTFSVKAQDTLSLNLKQLDSLFISNNMELLAAKCRIDATSAAIVSAKLWSNPTITTEGSFYNWDKNKYFDIGKNGQKIVSIEQLISIAGKRNTQIQIAKKNEQFSKFEFYEILRALKLEMHLAFYQLHYTQLTIDKYTNQLVLLNNIIEALQFQNQKGNIPLKDVLRLKAIYYQLNNEKTEVLANHNEALKTLSVMLQVNKIIKPVIDSTVETKYNINSLHLPNLLAKAESNRPDLKLHENLVQQSELSIKLQRKQIIPDLKLGAIYDQAGSYTNNYTGVYLGFDIPLLNQNQGNIKMAKAINKQYQYQLAQKKLSVETEVRTSYNNLYHVEQEYQKLDADFNLKFEELNNGVMTNFQKRNISLMEFTDFFEAYNNSIQQVNKLKQARIEKYEELNYVIGEELFK